MTGVERMSYAVFVDWECFLLPLRHLLSAIGGLTVLPLKSCHCLDRIATTSLALSIT